MYFGQTSNWRRQVKEVSNNNCSPSIASQYTDGTNAIRIHCGAESQVLMKVEFYMTSEDDFEELDSFLKHFGLPRNGYKVIDTHQAYTHTYPAYAGPTAYDETASPLPIAAPGSR
jgi:hypothetical protein